MTLDKKCSKLVITLIREMYLVFSFLCTRGFLLRRSCRFMDIFSTFSILTSMFSLKICNCESFTDAFSLCTTQCFMCLIFFLNSMPLLPSFLPSFLFLPPLLGYRKEQKKYIKGGKKPNRKVIKVSHLKVEKKIVTN